MISSEFLELLLKNYEATFDIHRNYEINEREYPGYGYFCSHGEKYVLVKEAKLWEADSYEHILFQTDKKINMNHLEELIDTAENHIEPVLICKGDKNPPENHMYSFITLVMVSEQPLDEEVKKRIRKFKFQRNYMFSIRGYSLIRLIGVDLSSGEIILNGAAKPLKKTYKNILNSFHQSRR